MPRVLICTLENEIAVQNTLNILKHKLFQFVKPLSGSTNTPVILTGLKQKSSVVFLLSACTRTFL